MMTQWWISSVSICVYNIVPQLHIKSWVLNFIIILHHQFNIYTGGTVTGEITDVPGIGPAAGKKLATGDGDEKVTNTYQLIGKVS